MLNDKKTEFIVIGTRQQLVDVDSLCVGHTAILPSSEVRNLGGWFDNQLKMVTPLNQTCKATFFHHLILKGSGNFSVSTLSKP